MGFTDKLPMALLALAVVLIAGVMMVTNVEEKYVDEGVDMGVSNFTLLNSSAYAISDELNESQQDMNSKVSGIASTAANFADFMFGGAFQALDTLMTLPNLLYNLMQNIAEELGIPPVFIAIANTALFLTLLFAIIYIVFRIKA